MKTKLIFVCFFGTLFLLLPILGFSQFTHKIKADSVRIYNDNCTAELIVENSTSNIKGFLFNKGLGRTEFRKAVIKLSDSSFLIGGDTLTIKPVFNGLLPGSVLFYDGIVINQDNDNFFWDNTNKRLGIGTNIPQFRLDMPGYSTTVPQIRVASMEFQSYTLNNTWFGNNAYYDGGGFRYRNNGGAGLFYFLGSEGQFRFMPNGVAGTYWSSATGGVDHNGSTQMKITAEGTVALGGSMTYHEGNFTNAGMIVKSNGVLIGTTSDDGVNKLQVNGYTKASGFRIPSGTSTQFLKADGTVDNSTYLTASSLAGYLPLTGGTLMGALNGTTAVFSAAMAAEKFFINNADGVIGVINSTASNGGYLEWRTNGTTIADIGTATQIFGSGGNAIFGLNARGARSLSFGTNNTARYTIDASGNNLWSGSGSFAGNATANSYGLQSSSGYYYFDNYTGNNFMGLEGGSSLGVYIGGARRVQITSIGAAIFSRGTLNFQINPSYVGGNTYSQLQSTGALAFATSGDNNRMYIDGYGNVGVGTTTPVEKVEVLGNIQSTVSGGDAIMWAKNGAVSSYLVANTTLELLGLVGTASNHSFAFRTNNTERGRISPSGRWLFGTTTDDGSNLGQFNGNVSISNSNTFGQLKVSGTNTGYTQAHVLLQSSTSYNPESRGLGLYTFNEGLDVNWYVGNFYNAASVFGIGRTTGTSFDAAAADANNSLWYIAADGIMTYKAVQGGGNRIIATNNSGEIIALTVGAGLSLSGSTLSAIGGSSSITGAGTAAYIPLWNGTNTMVNSIMSQSSNSINLNTLVNSSNTAYSFGLEAPMGEFISDLSIRFHQSNRYYYQLRASSVYSGFAFTQGASYTLVDASAASFKSGAYNLGGLRVTANSAASTGAAIGIQQETAEGWTLLYADYEPYAEWGIHHNNPDNIFYISGGTSTNSIHNYNITNRSGNTRTAYAKISMSQNSGNIISGGNITAASVTASDNGTIYTAGIINSNGLRLRGQVSNSPFSNSSWIQAPSGSGVFLARDGGDYFAGIKADGNFYTNANGIIDGTLSASSFSGAGTGLTGAASNLTSGNSYAVATGELTDLNSYWSGNTSNRFEIFRYNSTASNRPSTVDNANWAINIYSHGTGGSGSYGTQLSGLNNGRVYLRNVSNGSFGSWYQLLHSGNFNEFSPTLTGGGASGNWGINITGTATNSTQWSGFTNGGTNTSNDITRVLAFNGSSTAYQYTAGPLQAFLGLGTAAYRAANQDLNTTSNVTFNQGTFTNGAFDSDERLKNIINRQVKTNISDRVNVMSYTWKDRNKGEGVQYGYSAQELKQFIPEAVVLTQNNTYAVNYNMVHSVLIDENTKKINSLEKTINELKEVIEKLKNIR